MKQKKTMDCDTCVDALGNTPLINAAADQDWEQVRTWMAQGADVRFRNVCGANALFYALIYGEMDLAIELFEKGARLDGLNSVDALGVADYDAAAMLETVAQFRRMGYDLFYNEAETLSESCRWWHYDEAEAKIADASQEELDCAVSALIRNGRFEPERNLALLRKLVARGGKIDLQEVATWAESKRPAKLRNPESYTAAVRQLAKGDANER